MTSALPTDIAVGLLGLRTFRIREDGYLLPVTFNADDDWAEIQESWSLGYCIARCRRSRYDAPALHEAPAEACRCGIYSWNTLARLQRDYRDYTDHVVAVVALEGQTIEGTFGFRSNAARIVALWLNDSLLPVRVQRNIRRTYPGIRVHHDRTRMIAKHMSIAAAQGEPQTHGPRARLARAKWWLGAHVAGWVGGLVRSLGWLAPLLSVVALIAVRHNDVVRLVAGALLILAPPLFLWLGEAKCLQRTRRPVHPVLVRAPIRRMS